MEEKQIITVADEQVAAADELQLDVLTIEQTDHVLVEQVETKAVTVTSQQVVLDSTPDLRVVAVAPGSGGGGGGVFDHGELEGLEDDDHPQYLTEARADALYSPLGHTHDIYLTEAEADALYDELGAADAAVSAHEAALDPHSQYLTQAEADALYSALGHGHDHGTLSGLTDDDHTQYHTDARALTWLGTRSTSDLPEGTNLYFTNERVDDRLASLFVDGAGIDSSYDDLNGTFTVAVDLSELSTTTLPEGSNLYYTDERVDDRVASLLVEGTGIDLAYVDASGTLTITADLSELSTTTLPEGTNLYYTDERVDDRVASLVQNGTGITWSYDDVNGTLTPTVTITQYTDELAQDAVGGILADSASIDFTYNDAGPSITATVIQAGIDHGSISGLADDDHAQYHNDSRALTWLGTRSTSDLPEGSNLYFTNERAQDAVGGILTDSSTVDFTYNDGGNTITASVIQSGLDHGSIGGLADNDHPQYLLVADIDDVPVNGELAQPISSNWAFDHVAAADPHPGYVLESAYTAADVLAKLLTVDGSGSGLDADLLDGQSGAYYLDRANHTGTQTAATISDFAEAVDDRVAALATEGVGIDIAYSDAGDTLTFTVDLSELSTSTLPEGTNLYFTDERAQDAVGIILTDSSTVDFAYNDAGGTITASVIQGGLDHGSIGGLSDNDHPQYLLVADIDDTPVNGEVAAPISSNWAFDHVAASDPHPGYVLESALNELVDDRVDALLQDASGLTWTYSDAGGTLTPAIDHGGIGGLGDDDHTQYHNDSRALTWLGTRSTSDLPEGSNLYYTDERVDDRVAALLVEGPGITLTYDDGAGTLTIESAAGSTPTDITVADTTDASCFVALFESATGDLAPKTDAALTYDASTGFLGASGITVGNAGLHILDTDASHDLILAAGSNLSADRTLTFTTGDANRTLTINGSTTLGGGSHSGTNTGDEAAASDTVAGVIELAVQSEMESASDNTRAVTPGRVRFNPGVAKAWAYVTYSGGTPSATASLNMTSITDVGTGTSRAVFATDFSGASNYCEIGTMENAGAGNAVECYFTSAVARAAGSSRNFLTSNAGTAVDVDHNYIFFGDQ